MLHLLFFCSGISGLIYQVVWVRAFGNVFGNTIQSASLVVAVFMLGLGAGSYAAGRWADRRAAAAPDSLLWIFGAFEAAVGVLALGLSAVLPRLADLSAALSSYTPGPHGWYVLSAASHVMRAGLATVLLAPITLLMGGTLTLLIRYLVNRRIHASGWPIAVLFGANTAGAAVGCFATDFALVPRYGLQGAQLVAFGFNMVAAGGALLLARARGAPDRPAPPAPNAFDSRRDGPRDPRSLKRTIAWTIAAMALSGFAAMGIEIVWFRYFSILLGEYRAVFSLLLTIVLAGIGAGAVAGGWLDRRLRRPAEIWMVVQGLFVAATLAGLAAVDARDLQQAASAGSGGWPRAWAEVWFNAAPILVVAGAPSVLMGFAFPLANAVVQRTESRIGARAGLLYLANTAGAVGGSLAAGFVLLPSLGLQRSVTVLMSAAACALVALRAASRAESTPSARRAAWTFGGPLGVASAALAAWVLLPGHFLLSRALLFGLDKAYAVSEGLTEVIAVTDGPDGGRVLVTNGHPMSSTALLSQRYMRAMAHLPLLAIDDPARVLVLCYGVGNTAHAVTLHDSVTRIDVVDLSRGVLEHSSYFADVNRDVLQHPRVAVHVNDGRHHLRMMPPGVYDLITLEPPPIVHAGVGALYSREFYAGARSRLTPAGYISQWLPVFGVPEALVLSMIRSFVEVFPNAVLLSGAHQNLLLIGAREGRVAIDPARIEAALANAPAVRADLERLELGSLREIAGAFVADAATLVRASAGTPPVTDDRPIQEYGRRSLIDFGDGGIPAPVIAVQQAAAWCPDCFTADRAPLGGQIRTYLAVSELAYRSRSAGGRNSAPLPRGRTILDSAYLGAIVPDSPALDQLLAAKPAEAEGRVDAAARYAEATAMLESGRFAEAVQGFRAVLAVAPDAAQAHNNLGVALASLGRMDDAVAAFRAALAIQPDFADARRNLTSALAQQRRDPGSS